MACNFVVDDEYEAAEEVDDAPTILTLLLYRLLCNMAGAHAEVLAIPVARRRIEGRLVRMVREVMMVRPVVVVRKRTIVGRRVGGRRQAVFVGWLGGTVVLLPQEGP